MEGRFIRNEGGTSKNQTGTREKVMWGIGMGLGFTPQNTVRGRCLGPSKSLQMALSRELSPLTNPSSE